LGDEPFQLLFNLSRAQEIFGSALPVSRRTGETFTAGSPARFNSTSVKTIKQVSSPAAAFSNPRRGTPLKLEDVHQALGRETAGNMNAADHRRLNPHGNRVARSGSRTREKAARNEAAGKPRSLISCPAVRTVAQAPNQKGPKAAAGS
jgi:hypothetical protein